MSTYFPPEQIADLTSATIDGTGVFDVLMRANKAHLEQEFTKGRIKGPEYATVYLGALDAVLSASIQFLLQRAKAQAEIDQIKQQTELLVVQTANAVIEGKVLEATECKLKAEFDVLKATLLKIDQETQLLMWKTTTEKAQTIEMGVDANSVVGRQKDLYKAQTDGFTRDAEQKVAKVMVDSWNVRRTTDEGTVADGTNMLNDAAVGRAVTKLLTGVGA